jgi:predicted deacetylase
MLPPGIFFTIVHDVAPVFQREISTILRLLAPLVGRQVGAALVPCWHATALDLDFIRRADRDFGELLIHGLTHRRSAPRGGPRAWLTRGADEFGGLDCNRACARVRQARRIMVGVLGRETGGFVPPAWQMGALSPAALARSGIRYCLGMRNLILCESGSTQRLATWSWDAGRWAWAGYAGHALGVAARVIDRAAVPCVVVHPADLARGFVPCALALIRNLLAHGLRPVLPGQWLCDGYASMQ